jgi:UDP-sulfoquinovose synthase
MRVLIAGIDGYLGWALAQYLTHRGHKVGGVDAFFRRRWVNEMGSQSAIPIAPMERRLEAFSEHFGHRPYFREGDLTDWDFVSEVFRAFRPDAVVHLGENPSAPYSMVDVHHATWVQQNNIVGTLNILYALREFTPDAHLVKLGTMGEYGTPNIDIPEGFFDVSFRGRSDHLPFPRQAGSWYHWSKVHDSNNVMFACRVFGLRSTDIMQGVVYGTRFEGHPVDDPDMRTRLDFDQSFGTAINRFVCQAVVGEPLTPFGQGHQTRGFLPLRDSMQCLTIVLEHPAEKAEYRVFNQFEETYSIYELAENVAAAAAEAGLETEIRPMENPRMEAEEHYYAPDHEHLLNLGYVPTHDMNAELKDMFVDLIPHRDRIEAVKEALTPDIRWDGSRSKSKYL